MILSLVLVSVGYLMGSICSAIIVCRIFHLPSPREEGSKNPGSTNVLRIAGKRYAALVMLADLLKGAIPVLLAKFLGADPITVAFTALAAVFGHMYPIFFGFKGGKGVATAIGALLAFQFIVGIMVAATWLLVVNVTHYASLASIVAITLSPLYALALIPRVDIFPPLLFMVILIVFKHKSNITRLMDGTEPKIAFKRNVIKDIMESPLAVQDAHEEETIEPQAAAIMEKTPPTQGSKNGEKSQAPKKTRLATKKTVKNVKSTKPKK